MKDKRLREDLVCLAASSWNVSMSPVPFNFMRFQPLQQTSPRASGEKHNFLLLHIALNGNYNKRLALGARLPGCGLIVPEYFNHFPPDLGDQTRGQVAKTSNPKPVQSIFLSPICQADDSWEYLHVGHSAGGCCIQMKILEKQSMLSGEIKCS